MNFLTVSLVAESLLYNKGNSKPRYAFMTSCLTTKKVAVYGRSHVQWKWSLPSRDIVQAPPELLFAYLGQSPRLTHFQSSTIASIT